MDLLDWIVRISGVGAVGFLVINGISRFRLIPEGDPPLVVQLIIFLLSATWVCSLCLSAAMPINTVVYLSNGSDRAYDIRLGDWRFCLPGRSYQHFTWRRVPTEELVAHAAGSPDEERFAVTQGTWFINVSPTNVYVDVIDLATESIGLNAFYIDKAQKLHFDATRGRPYQLYSQPPVDRIYSLEGDIKRRRAPAPCPSPGS